MPDTRRITHGMPLRGEAVLVLARLPAGLNFAIAGVLLQKRW